MGTMCGRYTQTLPWDEMVRLYRITETADPPNIGPRYNIAPTQEVPIARPTGTAGRAMVLARVFWGLVPFWAKERAIGARMINARAETVAVKPAFRAAFRTRRCLVPADGFYEWRREYGAKQPYLITMDDGGGFAFAGLWERWEKAPDGVPVESCTIITTEANALLRPVHPRMPVILAPGDYNAWLDPDMAGDRLAALLRPYPGDRMAFRPVSRRVNNARHDDPDCTGPPERLLL